MVLCNIVPPIITFDTALDLGGQLLVCMPELEDPQTRGFQIVLPMSKLDLQVRDPVEGMGGASEDCAFGILPP